MFPKIIPKIGFYFLQIKMFLTTVIKFVRNRFNGSPTAKKMKHTKQGVYLNVGTVWA